MSAIARTSAIVLGLLIGGFFVYLSLRSLDWAIVAEAFARAKLSWIFAGVCLLACAYLIRLERWWLMLVSIGSSASRTALVAPFLGSFALNNVLPLRLGDVARAAAFTTRIGVSVSAGTASLLVERVLDFYALIFVGLMALLLMGSESVLSTSHLLSGTLISLGALLAFFTLLLFAPRMFAKLGLVLLATPIGKTVPRKLAQFGLRTLLKISQITRRAGALRMIGMSIVAWAFEGAVVYAAARALNTVIEPAAGWLSLIVANIATLLPGTPGHFGTFHFMGGQTLTLSGLNFSASISVITLAHFIIWMGITIAGFSALYLQRRAGTVFAERKANCAKRTEN